MQQHRWILRSGLALLLGVSGCTDDQADAGAWWAESTDAAVPDEGDEGEEGKADHAELSFQVFEDDIGARGQEVTRVVFTTKASYRQYFGHNPPASINFNRQWVLFYSAGVKRTGGYTASIDRITPSHTGKTLTVATRLIAPGEGCLVTQALTKPQVLVAFQKPARKPTQLRSTHADEAKPCAQSCEQLPPDQCVRNPDCEIYAAGCEHPPIDPDTGLPRPCDPVAACRARTDEPVAPRHVRKVALVTYDPVHPTTGQRLSAARGWSNADYLEPHSEELATALRVATTGHVDFRIVTRHRVDEFPVKRDGFRYDWTTFSACMADSNNCHRPDDVAYTPLMREDAGTDLCTQIADGTIDEVWVWGFDYSGFDEFAFKIPGDRAMYATTPYNYWIYDGRIKDLPECGRTYFVMGWNATVPGANALHSFGHRAESALTISPAGRGLWGACDGSSEWTDFTCIAKDGGGTGGCGNVHYPPNATADYQYDSSSTVQSYCDDYANYPNVTKASSPVTASTWSPVRTNTQWDYLTWWFAHLPRGAGSHPAGGTEVSNDWWNYVLCYDGPCPLAR